MTSAIYPVEKNSTRVNKYVENSKKFNWDQMGYDVRNISSGKEFDKSK